MIIAVAGPYSAPIPGARSQNLAVLNNAAAALLAMGHTPVVGVNAALPVVDCAAPDTDRYRAIMNISMAAISACEAILVIGSSPGADREAAHFQQKRLPVYRALADVPRVL